MKKTLSMLAIMSAVLVSCEKPENRGDNTEPTPDPEYSISISPTELTFGAEGGEQSVTVTSSEDWYIDGESDWCEVSASYGESGDKILIKANPNTDTENSRRATLVFTCGDKMAELTINQQKDELIEFKDFEFLQAILRDDYEIDVNRDREISKAEAALVTDLNVSMRYNDNGSPAYKKIKVMDEIKYFTALTSLDCHGNQLTTLDLSKNTALTRLSCWENQLTSLYLNNNTALESLDCSDNQLATLDLNNNTALTSLSCSGNQFISLDLSNHTALESLYCYDNQLTSLDLSNNTALTYLNCSDNQLATLDARNSFLSGSYCNLLCSDNPLEKIILSESNRLYSDVISRITKEYGDIIEYVE